MTIMMTFSELDKAMQNSIQHLQRALGPDLAHVSSVQNPSLIPLNPGWFSAGFLYWIIIL